MIWEKLETKLASIMRAMGSAMDEPEGLLQLVLGMSGEGVFDQLFGGAAGMSRERLDQWFDQVAGTLGGDSALKTVQDLVGRAASFDLSQLKDVPPVDLPDLLPFFQGLLVLNRRRPKVDGFSLSFKTPDEWLTSHATRRNYENLSFDRKAPPGQSDLMGVGHPLMEKALQQASRLPGTFCVLDGLADPMLVIAVSNRVTDKLSANRRLIFGISGGTSAMTLKKDWEVLAALNSSTPRAEAANLEAEHSGQAAVWVAEASAEAPALLEQVDLPFDALHVDTLAVLWSG